MLKPFSAEIGPYSILLPGDATLDSIVERPSPEADPRAFTRWIIELARYQVFVHLDARHELADLKDFIDFQTRSNVSVDALTISGIAGVSHGDYGPARTWIDWWFKRGDTMICLCLQSVIFPVTEPTPNERAEHQAIVNSLKFIPDDC
jgi:hypothetical protein